jgi:hypothetical protein
MDKRPFHVSPLAMVFFGLSNMLAGADLRLKLER